MDVQCMTKLRVNVVKSEPDASLDWKHRGYLTSTMFKDKELLLQLVSVFDATDSMFSDHCLL